jgi:hypothetical protein
MQRSFDEKMSPCAISVKAEQTAMTAGEYAAFLGMYHGSIEGISAVYSRKWGIPSMQGALVEFQISNNQPLAHTDFLWGAYKPSCWWFECFELLRKFCLVGLPVLTRQGTDEDSHIEDAYGMLAVVLSLVVYTVGDPYSKQADKLLQIPVQVDLLLFLICGMLLNFAANHEGASAAMEVAVSVLIIGTCAPLFLVLVWAVIDPHTIDAWAESSTVLTKMRAQATVVVNQNKQMARVTDGGRGGWRGTRFLAPAPPTDDIRPGKHGLLWMLRWVSKCLDEDEKQGKLDLAGQQDPESMLRSDVAKALRVSDMTSARFVSLLKEKEKALGGDSGGAIEALQATDLCPSNLLKKSK